MAQVLGWPEGWPIGGVEVDFEVGQERLRRLYEPVEMVPPAMACQSLLDVAPQPLDQIELR